MELNEVLIEELSKQVFNNTKSILENIINKAELCFQGISIYLYTLKNNGSLERLYKIGLETEVNDFDEILKLELENIASDCEFKEYKDLLQPNGTDKIAYIKGNDIPLYSQIIKCIEENKVESLNPQNRDTVYKKSKGYIVNIDYNDEGTHISDEENISKRILYFGNIKKNYLLKSSRKSYMFSSGDSCVLKKVKHNVLDFIPYIKAYSIYCNEIEDYIVYICDGDKFERLFKYDKEKNRIAREVFDNINNTGIIKNISVIEDNLSKKSVVNLLYKLDKINLQEVDFDTFKGVIDSVEGKDNRDKLKFSIDEDDSKIIIDDTKPIESIKCILSIYSDKLAMTLAGKELVYAE